MAASRALHLYANILRRSATLHGFPGFRYRPRNRRDTETKHTTGKSKPKLVSGPIVRVIHQSMAKRHQFENCNYKVLYGR